MASRWYSWGLNKDLPQEVGYSHWDCMKEAICVCVCVWAHAYVYKHIQRPKKGIGILSLLPPTYYYYYFKTGILTESKALFFFLARWAGWLHPGVCLSLLSSVTVTGICGQAQIFYGCWELRSSCFNIKHLYPLSYQPSTTQGTSANKYTEYPTIDTVKDSELRDFMFWQITVHPFKNISLEDAFKFSVNFIYFSLKVTAFLNNLRHSEDSKYFSNTLSEKFQLVEV